MAELAGAGDGWINLRPDVDPDDVPPRGGFGLFSARGPSVPLCTWMPADAKHQPPRVSIGIQHGGGQRALRLLTEVDIRIDPAWRMLSDNPRRGVVIAVPATAPHDVVLGWLLQAGEALCPFPHTGWVAVVHLPR
jgi:hypothetical protein